MNSLLVIFMSIIFLYVAYQTYAKKIGKIIGIDSSHITPAYKKQDDLDFFPSNKYVILGHHFASIAGAGTIMGPIQASIYGWLPVLIWIIIAAVFFGGVLDYGTLLASLKHEGSTIGDIIETYTGGFGKFLFNSFAWLSLLFLIASFIDIVSTTFVNSPEAATSSILFILISLGFGLLVYKENISLFFGSLIGILLLVLSIRLSLDNPIIFSKNQWIIFISIYIFIASIVPVWLLLQPRDYLNSYLLYSLMIGTVLGIIFSTPNIEMSAFNGFKIESKVGNQFLFPVLFMTVSGGAISGYHSLIASGSTSKQIKNEKDAKMIGYGSMLIEAILAVLALMTAAHFTDEKFSFLLNRQGPIDIFAKGIGSFLHGVGIPFKLGNQVILLCLSALSLTSLDTITRSAGKILQEIILQKSNSKIKSIRRVYYLSFIVTIILGCLLALGTYEKLWTVFGIANQLLAVFALFTLSVWLKRTRRNFLLFCVPMVFLQVMTFCAILLEIERAFVYKDTLVLALLLYLFSLSCMVIYQSIQILFLNKVYRK